MKFSKQAMACVATVRDTGERLAPRSDLVPGVSPAADPASIFVDAGHAFQTVEGLGGAFTEASARVWQKLGPANRDRVVRAYFDPAVGHGYSLCRTHIGSCDFSDGNYGYAEAAGGNELKGFSVARDEEALLPLLRAARAVSPQPIKLLASPWSPPAWMKTTGIMLRGGKLRSECQAAWALYFARYVKAYRELGFPIWAITVQNEPEATQSWESCIYTGEEERDFVRDHLGPTMEREGLGDVRIVVWDHNRDVLVQRAAAVLNDPAAARYVWGVGFHWYVRDCFHNVQLVHDAWPDKHLLFTEGCQEGGPHIGSWMLGERYARSIIADFNRWTEGWIDWNLLLDATGGPNHVGNLCSAPIIADTERDELIFQSSYYYLGHFARYVQPGARRILCASSHDDVEATAFLNPDGRMSVVALNRTEAPLEVVLRREGAVLPFRLPARSILTIFDQKAP